MWKQLAFSE